ncbi:MAG: hypothetical protein AB7U35_06220 [Sphingobium sp.]
MTTGDKALLARPLVAETESVIRALHEPFWDNELQRGTPSAFKGRCVSVNRTSVLPEAEIIETLRRKLDNPSRRVEGIARVRVATIVACAPATDDEKATTLCVMEAPEPDDASHAEIVGTNHAMTEVREITRSLGKKILDACEIQKL